MAKKSSVEKNKKRMRLVRSHAARRARLKAQARNLTLLPEERFAARLKLAELPRNSSRTRVRGRCALTGRARGYYRKFKMSRIALRKLASAGLVTGVVKSSW